MTDSLEVWIDDGEVTTAATRVGELSHTQARGKAAVRYEYAESWLESKSSFAIDPELQLTPGAFHPRPGCVLHGAFRDSAPDRWGRVLMERREAESARNEGRAPRRLGDWEFLTGVNDATRIGSLRLFDAGTSRFVDDREPGVPPLARLRELEAAARAIDEASDEARSVDDSHLRLILAPGSSLGGARPKATFADVDGTLWIAKFPAHDDRHDVGAWEFLAHELAARAGVDVPRARVVRLASKHHTFCVERFDRVGGRRRSYLSAMTMLGRNDGDAASYVQVADALARHGDGADTGAQLAQLYRRIAFSIQVGNRDDHLRNHGFLRGRRGWRLSPAFDLNPNPDRSEHALAIDETDTRPSLAALRSTAKFYRLTERAAAQIEEDVRAALRTWRSDAQSMGIARREVEIIATLLERLPE